jgi:hypothetical protein
MQDRSRPRRVPISVPTPPSSYDVIRQSSQATMAGQRGFTIVPLSAADWYSRLDCGNASVVLNSSDPSNLRSVTVSLSRRRAVTQTVADPRAPIRTGLRITMLLFALQWGDAPRAHCASPTERVRQRHARVHLESQSARGPPSHAATALIRVTAPGIRRVSEAACPSVGVANPEPAALRFTSTWDSRTAEPPQPQAPPPPQPSSGRGLGGCELSSGGAAGYGAPAARARRHGSGHWQAPHGDPRARAPFPCAPLGHAWPPHTP